MIDKVSINTNLNNKITPSFKAGPLDAATWVLQQCNTYPMVGVSVIDAATAIIPRTVVDAKTNGFAAAETFRRESSGLVVNCLIPGFFVLGAAKVFELFNKDYKGLSNLWANEYSLKELHTRYSKVNNVDKYVDGIFKDMQINVGKKWIDVDVNEQHVHDSRELVKEIIHGKKDKKELKKVYELFIENTKGAEHIRFHGSEKPFNIDFRTFLRDTVDCGKLFKEMDSEKLKSFYEKAVKFANKKSLTGLAIIIPLAASVQSINRWITRKSSGKEGAPIYKDFIRQNTKKEMTQKEKAGFWMQKLGAAALMVGVALLSLKEKPSLASLQFNKILPSMDQCRWIATSTFASRMLASEDENELREATFRDIATFCSLYFFGDYVNKGVGSLIKKFSKDKTDLFNYLSDKPKSNNIIDRFKYWARETNLKSFDEAGQISKKAKNLRSLCEISSLGFSMLLLGILVPWYVRKQTESKRKKELEMTINRYHSYPTIFPHSVYAQKAFQAFGTNFTEAEGNLSKQTI